MITPTQKSILTDLANGYQPKEIAYKRGISLRTVSQHMTDAKERLGAKTTAQAIAKVLKKGIVSFGEIALIIIMVSTSLQDNGDRKPKTRTARTRTRQEQII